MARRTHAWGRCYEISAPPAYQPLVEALRDRLPALQVEHPGRAVSVPGGTSWKGCSALEPIWHAELARLLPELAPADGGISPPTLTPEEEKRRLLEAIARAFLALAEAGPHLVLLEDAHWMDPASLEALRYLVPRLPDAAMRLVITIRTEELPESTAALLTALEGTRLPQRIELPRLNQEETAELVQQALELSRPAPRFSARLYAGTEGNPFYLIETLQTLMAEGLLRRGADGIWSTPWDASTEDYAELPMPAGVVQSIARRLDRLSPPLHELVGLAAVIGRDVSFDLWLRASNQVEETLLAAGDELCRRGLFLCAGPQSSGGADYTFAHDQIRRVVYDRLVPPRRRAYHRRVAQALEMLDPSQATALAHHFAGAQLTEKAVHYHYRAGQDAERLNALATAVEHFNQAVALAGLHRQFELLAARERVLGLLGDHLAQAQDLEAMQVLAEGHRQRLAEVHRRWAWFLANQSQYDKAEDHARQSLELAQQQGDPAGQAAALVALGAIYNWRGQPAGAIAYLESAVATYRQLGEPRQEAETRSVLGSALLGLKQYHAAQREIKAALACYRDLDDRSGQAEQLATLGVIQMELGHLDTAADSYQLSLELCRGIGFRYGEARALLNLANVHYFQGRFGRALEQYAQAAHIFALIGNRRGEAMSRANSGSIRQAVLGDSGAARAEVETALAYYREVGDLSGEGQCLAALGDIARCEGRFHQGRQYLETGVEKLLAAGEQWIVVQAYRSLAILAMSEGQPALASSAIASAEAICTELGLEDTWIHLFGLRGLVLLAQGQPGAAVEATRQAVERLKPGIEQAYLVMYWHHQALLACERVSEARTALDQARRMLLDALQGLSPDQQRMSLEQVPEHRAVVAAWEKMQGQSICVRLPSAGAPTGRPLRDAETVTVTWTVRAAEDEAISPKGELRRQRLRRLLQEAADQGAAPTVDDLAAALEVSQATIKRDLAAMRGTGGTIQTRGSRK